MPGTCVIQLKTNDHVPIYTQHIRLSLTAHLISWDKYEATSTELTRPFIITWCVCVCLKKGPQPNGLPKYKAFFVWQLNHLEG